MRVLFTGATGVIGELAVPQLIAAGHQVDAVYRSDPDAAWLKSAGANPIKLDLFDADAVRNSVATVDAIAHFATSIPPLSDMRKRSAWETNDRLRTEATTILVRAALDANVEVFIQESITFNYADGADTLLDESSHIDPPRDVTESALAAERLVNGFTAAGRRGIVLRMAALYGPGDASAEYAAAVAAGKIPIIGNGSNYVSSLATVDAASAVVAALDAPSGIYNVSDDTPVQAAAAVSSLASALGAKTPRRVPKWVARLAVGKSLSLLTRSNRIDNRHFKEVTGWSPQYPIVTRGWAHAVAKRAAA